MARAAGEKWLATAAARRLRREATAARRRAEAEAAEARGRATLAAAAAAAEARRRAAEAPAAERWRDEAAAEAPRAQRSWRPDPTTPSGDLVYVVAAVGTGLVKVGMTYNIRQRMKSLRDGCPGPLALIYAVDISRSTRVRPGAPWPTARDIEQLTHQLLSKHRERGEWFRISPGEAEAAVGVVLKAEGIEVWASPPTKELWGIMEDRRRPLDDDARSA